MKSAENLIIKATQELIANNIISARLDAEIILSSILKTQRLNLISNINQNINLEEEILFKNLIDRRINNEPIAYITNNRSFWNENYYIDKRVLIPRPETEILIDMVIKKINNLNKKLHILDLGCGSGCLLISLIKYFKNSYGVGLDVSKDALVIFRKNIYKYNLSNKIKIIHGDIKQSKLIQKFDIIVSNPPYLKNSEYQNLSLDIKKHEPKIAFIANRNEDGTFFYKKILKSFLISLKKGGLLGFEIGDNQYKEIEKLLRDNSFKIVDRYKMINDQIRCLLAIKL